MPNSGITSVLQDAEAHSRWHPIGDGYTPRPGDWVLFDEHVEVVTKYADGVLYTIGGDSGSNLSVNAHQYGGPLTAQGVSGFVNNGELAGAVSQSSGSNQARPATQGAAGAGGAATASGNLPPLPKARPACPGWSPPHSAWAAAGRPRASSRNHSSSRSRAARRLRIRLWPGPRRFPVRGRFPAP